MARDAALLHTSDGRLESALRLFAASIEAFMRTGGVAQPAITLASLPPCSNASNNRPSRAPCSVPCRANRPAPTTSFRSPISAPGCATHWAASGRSAGPPPVPPWSCRTRRAYALNQIDVAQRALVVASEQSALAGLTAREMQVLRLVADGATTRAISERLFISAKTADNDLQHIYTKLGVTNRAAATRWALEHNRANQIGDPEGGGLLMCRRTHRRSVPPDPADQGWRVRERTMILATTKVKDLDLPGGVRRGRRGQARLARLEGLHRLPRPDRGGPGLGRLRLGRRGLDGVRHRPGDPGDHAGGRPPRSPSLGQFLGAFSA